MKVKILALIANSSTLLFRGTAAVALALKIFEILFVLLMNAGIGILETESAIYQKLVYEVCSMQRYE